MLTPSSFLPQTPSLGFFCTDNQLLAKDRPLATLKPETVGEKPRLQFLGGEAAPMPGAPGNHIRGGKMPLLSKRSPLYN